MGMLAHLYSRQLLMRRDALAGATLACALSFGTWAWDAVGAPALCYVLLWVAVRGPGRG